MTKTPVKYGSEWWDYCPKCGAEFDTDKELNEHFGQCKSHKCKNPRCSETWFSTKTDKFCRDCLANPCKHCGSFCTEKIVIRYDHFSVSGETCTDSTTYSFRVCNDCGKITLPKKRGHQE